MGFYRGWVSGRGRLGSDHARTLKVIVNGGDRLAVPAKMETSFHQKTVTRGSAWVRTSVSPPLRWQYLPVRPIGVEKQGVAWGSGLPNSAPRAADTRAASRVSLRTARGRCGPGRCVVAARGGGAAAGREGGGKIAALPLAAGSLAASGGDGGSGGNARPGVSHSPAPLRPTRPGPWLPGGGLRGGEST